MNQLTFAEQQRGKKAHNERFFDKMDKIIPWDVIIKEFSPYYYEHNRNVL